MELALEARRPGRHSRLISMPARRFEEAKMRKRNMRRWMGILSPHGVSEMLDGQTRRWMLEFSNFGLLNTFFASGWQHSLELKFLRSAVLVMRCDASGDHPEEVKTRLKFRAPSWRV